MNSLKFFRNVSFFFLILLASDSSIFIKKKKNTTVEKPFTFITGKEEAKNFMYCVCFSLLSLLQTTPMIFL